MFRLKSPGHVLTMCVDVNAADRAPAGEENSCIRCATSVT